MSAPTEELTLTPPASSLPAALELTRSALVAAFTRSGNAGDAEPRIASVGQRLRDREYSTARLAAIDGRPVGIALWELGHPSGITLEVLYLRPEVAQPARYARFLEQLTREVGPSVFAPGGLMGLSDVEETALMEGQGFAKFSRSEMRWPPARPLPPVGSPSDFQLRPMIPEDEANVAGLHRAAFAGTFDQYLHLSDPDPVVDSVRGVHDVMSGRHGEFLGWASVVAHADAEPVGASLVVRAPYGPLLIGVMTRPEFQGRGVGRSLVLSNLHALRARGETVAVLNVTEGNDHAVRLYERLGFVRSLGPEHAWYSRTAVPVAPGATVRGPPGRRG